MVAYNAKQLHHSEQNYNNIEEIEDHRHIETRERLCDTHNLTANIHSVPHVQTQRTFYSEQNGAYRHITIHQGTFQLMNQTQIIEDGYQVGNITL